MGNCIRVTDLSVIVRAGRDGGGLSRGCTGSACCQLYERSLSLPHIDPWGAVLPINDLLSAYDSDPSPTTPMRRGMLLPDDGSA